MAEYQSTKREERKDDPKGVKPIISMENIHKTYLLGIEGVPALRGVTVDIYAGEWVVIFGSSGGGKTTMLNIMGTIDKPTKGRMTICDTLINANTSDDTLAELRLSHIGFVFQSFNLLSSMTALENVELPMTLKAQYTRAERQVLSEASLQRVGLGRRLDHYPSQLSGGEQQRVTIARAIANMPEVLLLDEPTGDLDTVNTRVVIDVLNTLNTENKMTMVMVTHDMFLKNFAHRVIWMRDGRVARIEVMDPNRRLEALKDLKSQMKTSHNVATGSAAGAVTWSNTEVRKITDYHTYAPGVSVPVNYKKYNKAATSQDFSRYPAAFGK